MTVLSACRQAARLMVREPPASIFSTTDTFALELAALVNESAKAIFKAHDWRALTVLNTYNGDGVTTAFTMPTDYDRMPVSGLVYTSRTQTPLTPIPDLNTWLDMQINTWTDVAGRWILLGGTFQIEPVLATGQTAKFYYLSNLLVQDDDLSFKAEFDADSDVFRLSERLLGLDLIWRWRSSKGLEYAEQMQNFQIAMAEEAGREKGARKIVVGNVRVPAYVEGYAYPGTIVP